MARPAPGAGSTARRVRFEAPEYGVAPGQAAVLYDGDRAARRRLDRGNFAASPALPGSSSRRANASAFRRIGDVAAREAPLHLLDELAPVPARLLLLGGGAADARAGETAAHLGQFTVDLFGFVGGASAAESGEQRGERGKGKIFMLFLLLGRDSRKSALSRAI